MVVSISFTPWHPQAQEHFLAGDYAQAISIYEEIIAINPEVKSNYWYLGLILLFQEQEIEAQSTWLMAMMEGETEELEAANAELIYILDTEAKRQEELKVYTKSLIIRQNIKELAPHYLDNLLHLLQLSTQIQNYTDEYLQELEIIPLLQAEPKPEVNLELLLQTLEGVLNYPHLQLSMIDFTSACVPFCQNHRLEFLKILLPPVLQIGYFREKFKFAARLSEIYLQLNPHNPEFLGHLSNFYYNGGEFDQGIQTSKLLITLFDNLTDKVFASRQLVRGILQAFGYNEEVNIVNQKHQELLSALIAEQPRGLSQIQASRLFNANFFINYIEDNPRKNRKIQHQLFEILSDNIANLYADKLKEFTQGHLIKKKEHSPHNKIKIGYISYCFKSHSIGWLSRWLLHYHNREEFEIYGYFIKTNPSDDSLHNWFLEKFDYIYKANESIKLAEKIYADGINILIDLDSITLDVTCEVLALKPVPIQVSWLGFDAPGSKEVDYFIADNYVLPDYAQEYYVEKIWRLPQTYIAVDGFEVGVPTISRESLNIPSDGVIYLCAQRGFKRHPNMTRLQLKILKEVPNSYFLIKGLVDEKYMDSCFSQIAAEEGIDYSRLRFLPDVASEQIHRANLSIADIVLDTYPYNGATTTLETLWMCIPMVTRVGEQFSARNSYTMMMNAGITEGIAWTDEEYIDWGVRLGKDESLRQEISWKLKKSRHTSPLWNGKQFTREMEKAYQQMWDIYMQK
ncbi:MAG TPA: O-linked N-acetylglucosamine transferase, SPINDLY family protein [Nostocaceae cyanobacterium]|nr:O-linked N-acetylglucosamine transferase, SPINDLY family protein [Nostocaceae cyanobacterium]